MPFVSTRLHAPARSRRRKARRNPRRRTAYGKHRPTLLFGKKGWSRTKRSRLMKRGTRINPRRRKARRSRRITLRRNPMFRVRSMRRNPMRRRSHRRTRRNPAMNIFKSLTSKTLIMRGVGIGGGMVAGSLTLPLINRFIPVDMQVKTDKYLGLVNVALGILMFTMLKNKMLKDAGLTIAGTGMYDLIVSNVPQLSQMPKLPRSLDLIEGMFGTAAALPAAEPASASYMSPRLPLSSVARAGVPSLNASYMSPGSASVGFAGSDPYEGVEW